MASFIRLLALYMILASLGCATPQTPQLEVASIIDEWENPGGITDKEIISKREKALSEGIHPSPLMFADFETYRKIDQAVAEFGFDEVYEALTSEVQNNGRLRANRALTLLAHIDPTDRWMTVWFTPPDNAGNLSD